jgi:hypothetical protein
MDFIIVLKVSTILMHRYMQIIWPQIVTDVMIEEGIVFVMLRCIIEIELLAYTHYLKDLCQIAIL